MIARTWRGATATRDADAYVAYLEATGLRQYRATPGNRGAYLLRRADGERTEFLTLSLWDDLDAIRGFAGDDIDVAVFYPEDDRYLTARDLRAYHYEVASPASAPPKPPGSDPRSARSGV